MRPPKHPHIKLLMWHHFRTLKKFTKGTWQIIQTRDINNKDIKYIPINFKVVGTFFWYSLSSLKMPTRTLLVSLLCLVLGFSPVFVVYYHFVSTTFGAPILELWIHHLEDGSNFQDLMEGRETYRWLMNVTQWSIILAYSSSWEEEAIFCCTDIERGCFQIIHFHCFTVLLARDQPKCHMLDLSEGGAPAVATKSLGLSSRLKILGARKQSWRWNF